MIKIICLLAALLCSCANGKEIEKTRRAEHSAAMRTGHESVLDQEFSEIDLDIVLDIPGGLYSVKQTIKYRNNSGRSLNELLFNSLMRSYGGDLIFDTVQVGGQGAVLIEENGPHYFKLALPKLLKPGKSIDILLTYTVKLPLAAPVNSRLFAYWDNCLALDYFYPSLVVPADEDEIPPPLSYGDLVYNSANLYTVTIEYPDDFLFASSGVVLGIKELENGNKKARIATGPARSVFLAGGFNWTIKSAQLDGVTINVLGPDRYGERFQDIMDCALDGIKLMSQILCDYPYGEFDIAFVPAGWSAMEYPGIIAMGTNYIDNFKPGRPKMSFRDIELILIHETTHQWFFNLVGNDQLNEPWLDEAFAQYLLKYYFHEKYGPEKEKEYIAFLESTAGDARDSMRYLNLPVKAFENGREYTKVIYGKAPLILNEIGRIYGDGKFLEFLRWYLDKRAWTISDTRSFISDFDEFFGEGESGYFINNFKF